jgi:hypothetical protein
VDGHAVITDCNGSTWHLNAGDIMQFRCATKARWHIPEYIRKVAFCSEAVPQPLLMLMRAGSRAQRLVGRIFRADD